jgi:lysophospholipase L1-like esterase
MASEPPPSVSRLLRTLLYLSLLGAGSLAALLLAEVEVRWLAPQRLDYARPLFEPDDVLVFRMRPGFDGLDSQFEFEVRERTNSLGLRDRELGPKPEGGLRILALGDSYAFGHGVELEETYAKRLEERLRGALGRSVEVINAGVPAWSLLQELRFLEHQGLGLQPDMVLVGFYVGNDLVDSYNLFDAEGRPTLGVEGGQLVSRKAREVETGLRGASRPLRRWLAPRSHLYTLLRNRGSELLMRLGLRHVETPCAFFRRGWTPKMDAQWSLTRKLLRELRDLSDRRGLALVILLIPTHHQVHEAQWQEYLKVFELDASAFDLERPQRLLTGFCAQARIDCVDVLPRLREADAREPLYFRVDSHLNAAGHAMVADALAEHLEGRLGPPGIQPVARLR